MRLFRIRYASTAAVSAIVLTALLPQSAHAGTPSAKPDPIAHPVAGLTSAAQMVAANGHLFVSSGMAGSDVEVLSTRGKRVADITGEAGADGMVASADGKFVYVALATTDAISVIDTSTLAETARYTVDACPISLALAAGRLFYSFGCDDAAPAAQGVASIDPTSGGTPVEALGYLYDDAILRGNGSLLATADITNTLRTFTAGIDGMLTALGSGSLEESPDDMALTSNGDSVLVASGSPYQITSYSTSTGTQDPAYPGVAYPQAVATDPTGHYVAAGFKSYGQTASLYDQSSATIRWERYTASPNPAYWATNVSFDQMLPQTLVFSPSGSHVYGLVVRGNATGIYFFDSVITPTASKINVKVANVGPGKKHTAVATVPGQHGVPVTFTVTDDGVSKSLGTVDTNHNGVARKTFVGTYDGTVTACVEGTPAVLPATTKAKFTVASKTTSRLVGPHSTRHQIAFFGSYTDVNVLFRRPRRKARGRRRPTSRPSITATGTLFSG